MSKLSYSRLYSVSLAQRARREAKAENSNGNPIRLPSKVLALIVDPTSAKRIYVSESGGNARRIDLDVRLEDFSP